MQRGQSARGHARVAGADVHGALECFAGFGFVHFVGLSSLAARIAHLECKALFDRCVGFCGLLVGCLWAARIDALRHVWSIVVMFYIYLIFFICTV